MRTQRGPWRHTQRFLGNPLGCHWEQKHSPRHPQCHPGLQGAQRPLGPPGGQQGLLTQAHSFHEALTLGCSSLDQEPGVGGWCGREPTREPNVCPHCPGGESKQLDLGQRSPTCASALWQQPRGRCSLVQKTSPEGEAPPDCWNPGWCQGPKVGPLQPPPGDRIPRAPEAGLLAARTLSGLKP